MNDKTIIFTIIAKNYLPYARVLMRSAAISHPGWRRFVILVDHVDGYFDPREEDFEIVLSSDLSIPRSRWFHFKYSILELNTAVKPYAFEYLFRSHSPDRIVYLDPDIRIYSPLCKVVDALQTADIVLTPHLTGSLEDDKRPAEIDILRAGAYNLGFIAISLCRNAASFLMWWQQRLYDQCVVDLPRGLFVDQRWVDLVPGMFERVAIIRDPGYNVAYWNLSHRVVSFSEDGYQVAGSPLAFFHFSGFDPEQPDRLSRHQNRFDVESLPSGTQQLLCGYREDLLSSGYLACKGWPYAFETFQNGTRIPDLGRPVHHDAPELLDSVDDPFSDDGFQAFTNVWNSPVHDPNGSVTGISRLAYRIYRTRTDVQSAMPDIFGGHYKAFIDWILRSGRVEHGLGDVFLTTLGEGIETCRDHQKARAWPETSRPNEFSDDLNRNVNGGSRLRLTRLAAAIYDARPELQRYFPDPSGGHSLRFLVWLLTYGRKEHNLSAAHLAPLREQWRSVVAGLPNWWTRVRYQLVLFGMGASVHLRGSWGNLRAWQMRVAHRRPALTEWPSSESPREEGPPPASEYGVNLVGYFHSETGVGQSARAARLALQTTPVPLSLRCAQDAGPSRKDDVSAGPMSSTFPYSNNLFYVNADQTMVVRRSLGEGFYRHRANIGYWVWELDEFPARWQDAFAPYQEIWTPSIFCRNAISRKTSLPVFCFPYSVAPIVAPGMNREYFGLPPDKFLFLTAFDVLSVPERKNPLAAIRAFAKAFGPSSQCQLIVKVNNAHAGTKYIEMLRSACGNGSILLFDKTLRREEMDALTNCVDCVVSLHRSEGFGLLIAEAMYMGKPVIVTNYSGNIDFTRPDNSMLVDYRMIPVGDNCAPYDPTSQWADPDIEQAANHIKTIAGNKDLRVRLSEAGQKFVRETLSAETVGNAMRRRLEALRDTVAAAQPPSQDRKEIAEFRASSDALSR